MGRGWVNAVREASGAKKGKLFTKIAKEITVAVKMGNSDNPEYNPRLRSALRDAQKNSMPKDTVDRAIKRGIGGGDEANFDEMMYEGYGPNGVAVLIEALTDNRNRTVQDIRSIFTKHGGNLGETGSVRFMFDKVGYIQAKTKKPGIDAEEAAINAGANEVEDAGNGDWDFYTDPTEVETVSKALESAGWEVAKSEISFKPKTPTELNDEQQKEVQEFHEMLHDNDDVKNIYLSV